MSLQELEIEISQLSPDELAEFSNWFQAFRQETLSVTSEAANDMTEAQKAELLRRKAEYLANPSVAKPWNDGFFDLEQRRQTKII